MQATQFEAKIGKNQQTIRWTWEAYVNNNIKKIKTQKEKKKLNNKKN